MRKITYAEARRRSEQQLGSRMDRRAAQGQAFARELHETAPRGGQALNSFGQRRSAAGEPPAIEFGNLLAKLNQAIERDGLTIDLFLNHAALENYNPGARISPRPLAQPTVDHLRATPLPR